MQFINVIIFTLYHIFWITVILGDSIVELILKSAKSEAGFWIRELFEFFDSLLSLLMGPRTFKWSNYQMQRALWYKRDKIIVSYNLVNICNQYKFRLLHLMWTHVLQRSQTISGSLSLTFSEHNLHGHFVIVIPGLRFLLLFMLLAFKHFIMQNFKLLIFL